MRRTPSPCRSKRIGALLGIASLGVFAVPAPAAPPASDTVLVKLAGDATSGDAAAALDADDQVALPAGWRAFSLDAPVTEQQARAELAGVDGVDQVALPQRVRALGTPNDPLFGPVDGGYQWGLRNTGAWNGSRAGVDIDAVHGWAHVANPATVVVAVVDTGVQVTHPDLQDRIWSNPGEIPANGIDDDHDGLVDDVQGWDFAAGDASVYDDANGDRHGTHIAGVIAAQRDNGVGIAGVAANARIMPLKFIAADGSGWNVDAITAIKYAVNKGAKIINASFGGSTYDAALCDSIAWAASKGVLVVTAAGNSGQSLDSTGSWPAKCPEPSLLTVGAFTHDGQLASFSNASTTYVDVAAPGEWIMSTIPGGYGYMSGTSMATPFASGVAAAVLGQSPLLTAAQTRQRVLDGAVPAPELATKVAGGRRLSLEGALSDIPVATPVDTVAPTVAVPASPAPDAAVPTRRPTFTWAPSQDAESGLSHYRLWIDGAVAVDQVGATSAAPASDLAPGVHTWSVEAVDRAGNAARGDARTIIVDDHAPAAFKITQPTRGAQLPLGKTVVRWTPSADPETGVTAYQILLDDQIITSVAGTAVQTRTGIPAGQHRIAVRAVDGAGNATTTPAVTVNVRGPGGGTAGVASAKNAAGVRLVRVSLTTGSATVMLRSARPAAVRLVVTRDGSPVATLRARLRPGATSVRVPRGRISAGTHRVTVYLGSQVVDSATLRVA